MNTPRLAWQTSPAVGRRSLGVLLLGCAMLGASLPRAYAAKPPPSIQLFPTTVQENLKQTAESARAMEASMQEVIYRMDQQRRLLEEAKCEGANEDPGCARLRKAIGETYAELLRGMEAGLPEMHQAVRATNESLERRLRTQLGRKKTPRDLQALLKRGGTTGERIRRSSGKRRIGRMSRQFQDYLNLVRLGARTESQSLATLAADIYLDTSETLELIALIQEEVARSRGILEIPGYWTTGELTPEMMATVSAVKGILFGEEDDSGITDVEVLDEVDEGPDFSHLILE